MKYDSFQYTLNSFRGICPNNMIEKWVHSEIEESVPVLSHTNFITLVISALSPANLFFWINALRGAMFRVVRQGPTVQILLDHFFPRLRSWHKLHEWSKFKSMKYSPKLHQNPLNWLHFYKSFLGGGACPQTPLVGVAPLVAIAMSIKWQRDIFTTSGYFTHLPTFK